MLLMNSIHVQVIILIPASGTDRFIRLPPVAYRTNIADSGDAEYEWQDVAGVTHHVAILVHVQYPTGVQHVSIV